MVSLTALVLCVASTVGANDVVLLDFSASWCGPCKQMEPVVRRLETAGYPVRRLDIDREKELASQMGVTGVPCFILVANNRVIDRVEGATSYERLTQMFETLQGKPATKGNASADASALIPSAPIVRGQSPEPTGLGIPGMNKFNSLFNPKSAPSDNGAADAGKRPVDSFAPSTTTLGGASSPTQQAMFATVRLRVEDPNGHSLGTGTIVDQHDNEALVVTCGHLFRDSKGKGSIRVDLFGPGAPRSVVGQIIDYDLAHDIGVVAIHVDGPIQVAKVAPSGFNISKGNRVFSIGCDKGNPPTVLTSHVTAMNKYTGPANIEVAGQPVDGRSGGGLFSSDGMLIGVCNAADPADKEGIYAALATVHWQLTRIGQQRLFQAETTAIAAAPKKQEVATFETAATGAGPAAQPTVRPLANLDQARAVATAAAMGQAAMGNDMEVLCIVKSKSDPNGKSRVFVLNSIPPELIERMTTEMSGQAGMRNANDLSAAANAVKARLGNQPGDGSGPVVRGQSR